MDKKEDGKLMGKMKLKKKAEQNINKTKGNIKRI